MGNLSTNKQMENEYKIARNQSRKSWWVLLLRQCDKEGQSTKCDVNSTCKETIAQQKAA